MGINTVDEVLGIRMREWRALKTTARRQHARALPSRDSSSHRPYAQHHALHAAAGDARRLHRREDASPGTPRHERCGSLAAGDVADMSIVRRSPRQAPVHGALDATAILRARRRRDLRNAQRHSIPHRAIEPHQWNALTGTHTPFCAMSFERARTYGCVGEHTGWEPRYFTLHDGAGLAPRCPPSSKCTPTANSCSISPGLRRTHESAATTTPNSLSRCPLRRRRARAARPAGCGSASARRLLQDVQPTQARRSLSSVHRRSF